MSKKSNKVNDVLDRASRTVAAWPDWMRRREFLRAEFKRDFLGKVETQIFPRPPLPWKVRMHTERSVVAVILDADGRFVAECDNVQIADYICLAARNLPAATLELISKPTKKETP